MKNAAIFLCFFVMSCSGRKEQSAQMIPLDLDEVSGIEYIEDTGLTWILQDSGNENKIYALDGTGRISISVQVDKVENTDWEALASDSEGNIYIGDFGNNDNDRRDLSIYKINKDQLAQGRAGVGAKTLFNYPEQKDFPPKKSGRIYDAEAFFEHNGSFYLFTKNRSSGFDGSLNVYKIPNKPGTFAAQLIGSLTTCGKYNKCAITGADISADGKNVVLLSGNAVWLIRDFDEDNISNAHMEELDLGSVSQKEGIAFKDANTVLITDEKEKKSGGYLYEVKLSDLKRKP